MQSYNHFHPSQPFFINESKRNRRRFGMHDKLYFGCVMKGEMLIIDFRGAVAQGSQNLAPTC